jgi:hypothetical protein
MNGAHRNAQTPVACILLQRWAAEGVAITKKYLNSAGTNDLRRVMQKARQRGPSLRIRPSLTLRVGMQSHETANDQAASGVALLQIHARPFCAPRGILTV